MFFMNCGIHAREWVTQATCMIMINQVCFFEKNIFQLNVESNFPFALAFGIGTLCDWLEKLALLFQPMRSKTKTEV